MNSANPYNWNIHKRVVLNKICTGMYNYNQNIKKLCNNIVQGFTNPLTYLFLKIRGMKIIDGFLQRGSQHSFLKESVRTFDLFAAEAN